MKTALSILGSLLLSATCYAESATYTLEYSDNPPFSMSEKGVPTGVAINIVKTLFETANIKYVFKNVPLARAMTDALEKPNTCALPVQRAQDTEAFYKWVSPILITHSGLFMHADATDEFLTLSDAKGKMIGALRGSGDAEYLKRMGFKVEEVNVQEQNVEKLTNKRLGIWATDVLSAKYFTQKYGNTKATKEVMTFRKSLGSLACSASMPEGDVAKLQQTIDGMIKDGTIEKLSSAVL